MCRRPTMSRRKRSENRRAGMDDRKNHERVDQHQKRQQQQPLGDVVRHRWCLRPKVGVIARRGATKQSRSEVRLVARDCFAPLAMTAAAGWSVSLRAGTTSTRGEEKLLAARVAGTSQRPVVAERRRYVAEPIVDHDDTLNHWRQPDGADLEDIVRPNAEQLLCELHLLVRSHGA